MYIKNLFADQVTKDKTKQNSEPVTRHVIEKNFLSLLPDAKKLTFLILLGKKGKKHRFPSF